MQKGSAERRGATAAVRTNEAMHHVVAHHPSLLLLCVALAVHTRAIEQPDNLGKRVRRLSTSTRDERLDRPCNMRVHVRPDRWPRLDGRGGELLKWVEPHIQGDREPLRLRAL